MPHYVWSLASLAAQQSEPTLDRHFVQQIGESFGYGGRVTSAMLWIALTVAVFSALALLAARSWRRWRATHEPPEPPIGWITDPQAILDVLENALINRAKIELSFRQRDSKRRSAACSIEEVGPSGLVLELPEGIAPGPAWIGRQVEGFFRIGRDNTGKERRIFYHFSTTIAFLPPGRRRAARLGLAVPEKMVLSQKRAFLRMAPPTTAIPAFDILPEEDAVLKQALAWIAPPPPPETGSAPAPEGATDAPRAADAPPGGPPATLPGPGRELPQPPTLIMSGDFKPKDISGGGVRVEARLADKESAQRFGFVAGKSCYIVMELEDDPPERYLLLAVIRRIFKDTGGLLDMGLEFQARCRGLSEIGGQPQWTPLKGRGEPDLENWVVRKYLEIYREKGVEPAA